MSTTTTTTDGPGTVPDRTDETTGTGRAAEGDRRHLVLAVAGLVVLLSGMLALFAWPSANLAPRHVPLGVAGPASAASAVSVALERAEPGAFDVTLMTNRATAVAAVQQREIYGAFVLSPSGVEVLTASAASPVVAQVLGQAGAAVAAKQGGAAEVTDVVPLAAADPRGASLGAGLLPIVLGGMACAAVLTLVVRRRTMRFVGALFFAVLGGLALAAILHQWIGSIGGSYLAASGVMALAIAAVSFAVLGLESLLGSAGLGLGGVVMILFGNALSGAATAPVMLPTGWGTVGLLLPPGATNQLLRSVAFFDGYGWVQPTLVLSSWFALGCLLFAVSMLRANGGPPSGDHVAR